MREDQDLRRKAGVSELAMNLLYQALDLMTVDILKQMWIHSNPHVPEGALLRHQINVTLEKKLGCKPEIEVPDFVPRTMPNYLCCCGSPLDGSHDHLTCGPPIMEDEATAVGYELGGEA